MVSKTTRNRNNRLNRSWCKDALDDLSGSDFMKLENSPHPKIPGKTEFDYALWCMTTANIGAMINLFKKHHIQIPCV